MSDVTAIPVDERSGEVDRLGDGSQDALRMLRDLDDPDAELVRARLDNSP